MKNTSIRKLRKNKEELARIARENYRKLREAWYSSEFADAHKVNNPEQIQKLIEPTRAKVIITQENKRKQYRANYKRLRDAGYSRDFAENHRKNSRESIDRLVKLLKKTKVRERKPRERKPRKSECEKRLDYTSLDDIILSFLSYIADKADVSFPISIEHFMDNKPGFHFKFEYKNKYGDMDYITLKTYDLSFPIGSFLFDLYDSALNIILDSTKCQQDNTGLSDSDCTLNADDICTLKITEMTVPDQKNYELAMRWKYGKK